MMKMITSISCLSLCALTIHSAGTEAPPTPTTTPTAEAGHGGKQAPVAPKTEPIPEKYADEKAVAIKFEQLKPVGERMVMEAVLRIINPTDKPITFTSHSVPGSYSGEYPVTQLEHWKDGKWTKGGEGWVKPGAPLHPCVIAPGQSAAFAVGVYPNSMPTRVGVSYTHGDKEAELLVWSDKIER